MKKLIPPRAITETSAENAFASTSSLRALIGYKVGAPFLGYVLEPELRDLFVDWERSFEKTYEVAREIERRIHEDKESSQ